MWKKLHKQYMVRSWAIISLALVCAACGADSSGEEMRQTLAVADSSAVKSATKKINPIGSGSDVPTRYYVKDGYIKYTYSGLQEGTEEVYFAQYGMVEIKFTKTKRYNPFQKADEIIDLTTLMRDSAIYVVDNVTMNARRLDNALLYESALDNPRLDLNEVAEDMYRSKGGFISDTQIIAGVPAVKWSVPQANSTEWRWKGILMKTYVELPRQYVQVQAVEIDTSATLPDGIFDLPTEVNVQDGMSMKEWVEELSKPIERRKFFDLTDSTKHYDKQGNVIPKK